MHRTIPRSEVMSWAMLAAVALVGLAGCEYEAPLATEGTLPIDPALLGAWELIEDSADDGGTGDDDVVVVMRFSPTDYLVRDGEGHSYRGFFVEVGGTRCLQLEDLGDGIDAGRTSRGYLVGRCTLDGGVLTLSLLNDTLVSPKATTSTAALRAAIDAHRDRADLFEPVARLRRRLLPKLELPPPDSARREDRDRVEGVALAPGGRLLVAGLRSGHVAAIDLAAGRLVWSVAAHDRPVHALAFGDDDRWVLTAADDLRATLRRGDTGGEYVSFEAVPLQRVYEIALSSDARYAATRGFDGFGRVWDLRTDREVVELASYGFAFGPRGALLASTPGREPGAEILRIWPRRRDAASLRILPERRVQSLAFNRTGTLVAAAGGLADGRAVVWLVDSAEGRTLHEIPLPRREAAGEAAGCVAVAFAEDGGSVVAGASDGQVVRIDVERHSVVDTWGLPVGTAIVRVGFVGDDVWVTSLAEAPDSERADAGLPPEATRLFRAGTPGAVWTVAARAVLSREQAVGAASLPDGDLLLFDRADGRPVRVLRPFERGAAWDSLPAR